MELYLRGEGMPRYERDARMIKSTVKAAAQFFDS
jgi:hypothetical protein